jgi:hypothetical protein
MLVKQAIRAGVVVVASVFVLGGCSQPLSKREKGTLLGGGLGAATGAIIGAAVGNPGAGAAIGGALGAGSGALVGDQFQGQEYRQAEQQRQIEQQNLEIQRQRQELEELKRKPRTDEDEY